MPVATTTPKTATGPIVAERAVITSVDTTNKSVSVITTESSRSLDNVQIVYPFLDGTSMTGIQFMPKVGSNCYLWTPSDGTDSFVMGFKPSGVPTTSIDSNYSGDSEFLDPGDIILRGSPRNFVVLKHGGILQIGAGPLAQRVYIPLDNLIRDYFVKYHAISPLGEVLWDHAEIVLDEQSMLAGTTDVIFKFNCKAAVQDASASVQIRVGNISKAVLDASLDSNLLQAGKPTTVSVLGENLTLTDTILPQGSGEAHHLFAHDMSRTGMAINKQTEDDGTRISVVVKAPDSDVTMAIQVDNSGNVFVHSESNIHVEAEDSIYLGTDDFKAETPTGHISLNDAFEAAVKDAVFRILSSGVIESHGSAIKLSAAGGISIVAKGPLLLGGSSIVLDSSSISLGGAGAASDLLVNSKKWQLMLQTHVHPASNKPPEPPASLPFDGGSLGTSTKILVK